MILVSLGDYMVLFHYLPAGVAGVEDALNDGCGEKHMGLTTFISFLSPIAKIVCWSFP